MRDFLNGILAFIGASSLTDSEFGTVTATIPAYDQSTYDNLASILESREAVSVLQDKLVAYYKAKGTDVAAADTGRSNIYIGSVLE